MKVTISILLLALLMLPLASSTKWTNEDSYVNYTFDNSGDPGLDTGIGGFGNVSTVGGSSVSTNTIDGLAFQSNNQPHSKAFTKTLNTTVSFAFWWKPTINSSLDDAGCLFGSDGSGNTQGDFSIGLNGTCGFGPRTGQLTVDFQGGTQTTFTTKTSNFIAERWYFILVKLNESGQYVYVNGTLENSTSVTPTSHGFFRPTISSSWFAGGVDANFRTNSTFDEVRFYTTELTDAQILNYYQTEAGDIAAVSVELDRPQNGSVSNLANTLFNVSATPSSANLSNVTWQVWNIAGTLVNSTFRSWSGSSQNTTRINITLSEGTYYWNALVCAKGATTVCETDNQNQTFSIDQTSPSISITQPPSLLSYHVKGTFLNLNWTVSDSNLQTCWYDYKGTNTTVTCSANTTNVNVTDAVNKTIIFYANDSSGNIGSATKTWDYNIFQNSIQYDSTTLEFSNNSYSMNISYNTSLYTAITATLVYNGSSYGSSSSSAGNNINFTANIITPTIATDTNYTFYWMFSLFNETSTYYVNSSTFTQLVGNLDVDDCSVYTNVLLNYTIYDETTRIKIGAGNVTVELSALIGNPTLTQYANISFNKTGSNPVQVCTQNQLTTTYRLDATVKYSASNGYATEYHNIQNFQASNSTVPYNIDLYDLNSTVSTDFLITYKDVNLVPVGDALIEINRQYLSIDKYLPVEIPKTDSDGRTIGHMVLNDVIYGINVTKNGVVLAQFNNVRVYCVSGSACTLNLNAREASQYTTNVESGYNLTASTSYTPSTRTYTFTYSATDGASKNVNLTVLKYDTYANTTICSTSLSAISGSLSCVVPAAYTNMTGIAVVLVENNVFFTDIFNIAASKRPQLGKWRYILAGGLILTITVMGFTSGPMMLILFIVGFIGAIMMALLDTQNYLGAGAALVWLIIAAMIFIIKMNKGGNG